MVLAYDGHCSLALHVSSQLKSSWIHTGSSEVDGPSSISVALHHLVRACDACYLLIAFLVRVDFQLKITCDLKVHGGKLPVDGSDNPGGQFLDRRRLSFFCIEDECDLLRPISD